jgi:hypothetical protein
MAMPCSVKTNTFFENLRDTFSGWSEDITICDIFMIS